MPFSIIGVYAVEESRDPCFLVEAQIVGYKGKFDFGQITQAIVSQPHENWQVPFDEYLLNDEGTLGDAAPFPGPIQVDGSQRIAFLIYHLDPSLPLITPFGEVALLNSAPRPSRLEFIEYVPPH